MPVSASGVSKTYAWTGGRVGWAVYPTVEEALARPPGRLRDQVLRSCGNRLQALDKNPQKRQWQDDRLQYEDRDQADDMLAYPRRVFPKLRYALADLHRLDRLIDHFSQTIHQRLILRRGGLRILLELLDIRCR